jgi:hypothetical protein
MNAVERGANAVALRQDLHFHTVIATIFNSVLSVAAPPSEK